MSVRLNIYLPDRMLPDENADKVVLPVAVGNLTVIKDRAPTSQLLVCGAVQLLDSNNHVQKRWFINGGIADIAQDVCKIAVEEAVDLSSVTMEELAAKAADNKFYQQLYAYFKVFG